MVSSVAGLLESLRTVCNKTYLLTLKDTASVFRVNSSWPLSGAIGEPHLSYPSTSPLSWEILDLRMFPKCMLAKIVAAETRLLTHKCVNGGVGTFRAADGSRMCNICNDLLEWSPVSSC